MSGRKSRFENFSTASEKIALIRAVKSKPVLWDLTDSMHFYADAAKLAWEDIGCILNKDADECKRAWVALRDCHRYYAKSRAFRKNGIARSIQSPTKKTEKEWEFAAHMVFLPELYTKRTTVSRKLKASLPLSKRKQQSTIEISSSGTVKTDSESVLDSSSDESEDLTQSRIYSDYRSRKRKSTEAQSRLKASMSKMSKVLETINTPQLNTVTDPLLLYWAQLLETLPNNVGIECRQQITNILFEKQKKHNTCDQK